MSEPDAAILKAVVDELNHSGYEVSQLTEQEFVTRFDADSQALQCDCVFGMYRSEDVLLRLEKMTLHGNVRVVNPPQGIRHAARAVQTRLFRQHQINMPPTWLLPDEMQLPPIYPCWLKRGDGCAQQKDDVVYVANKEQAMLALRRFHERGVGFPIVACEHLTGDLVKFYGVEGTDFFYWYYASQGHSKFGLEAINGVEHGYSFSENKLHRLATLASQALQLPVYGGDAVISSDGNIALIDFNDWPSFSPCRSQAAHAIAKRIINTLI